jgi:hypothetical protein
VRLHGGVHTLAGPPGSGSVMQCGRAGSL